MATFDGVPDTLFIPLTARIVMSKKFPEYFYDKKALELEQYLPNKSIEENSNEYQLLASVARYYNMDRMVKKFINNNPICNICILGCGLETMYSRLDYKQDSIKFYEVDLPEVIESRRKVLGEGENEKLIGCSLFDLSWADGIDKTIPTLMIVSGVFQYFHNEDILKFIQDSKKVFKNAELIFDAINSKGVEYCVKYVQKTGNKDAMMYSYIDDPNDFAKQANVELIECLMFYPDARKMLKKKVGFYTKIAMWVVDREGRAKIVHVKL